MNLYLNRIGIKRVVLFILSLALVISISLVSVGASTVIEPSKVNLGIGYSDGTGRQYSPTSTSSGYGYLFEIKSGTTGLNLYPLIYLPTDINLSDYSYVYYSYTLTTTGAISYSFKTFDTHIYFLGGRRSLTIDQLLSIGGKYDCTFNSDRTIATVTFAIPIIDQFGDISNWTCAYNPLLFSDGVEPPGMYYLSVNNLVLSTDPFDLNTYNQLKEISDSVGRVIYYQKQNGATLEQIDQAVGQTNQKLDDINDALHNSDIDKTPVTDFNNSLDEYQGAESQVAGIANDIFETPVEINGNQYTLKANNFLDTLKGAYSSVLENFDIFSVKSSQYFRGTISSFIAIFGVFIFFPLILGILGSLIGRYRE